MISSAYITNLRHFMNIFEIHDIFNVSNKYLNPVLYNFSHQLIHNSSLLTAFKYFSIQFSVSANNFLFYFLL